MVPILAYLWIRSFESFASWLCVGLMGISTILLHILNIKLRWLAQSEAIFMQLKMEKAVGKYAPNEIEPEDANLGHVRGYESQAPETPSHVHPSDNPRYNGPPNAIYQLPEDAGAQRSPLLSNELQHLEQHQLPQRQPYQPRRVFENSPPTLTPVSHHQPQQTQYSPPRTSPQGGVNTMYGVEGEETPSRPSRMETPSTAPKRTPFGLRFGAATTSHMHTESPYYNMAAQEPSTEAPPTFESESLQHAEHDSLQRTPFHSLHQAQHQQHVQQQTPTSAYGGRIFSQTPKSGFAPPPRFSMQDM